MYKIRDINKLEIGDYIVHNACGIGVYNGIKTLSMGNIQKDYIELKQKDITLSTEYSKLSKEYSTLLYYAGILAEAHLKNRGYENSDYTIYDELSSTDSNDMPSSNKSDTATVNKESTTDAVNKEDTGREEFNAKLRKVYRFIPINQEDNNE